MTKAKTQRNDDAYGTAFFPLRTKSGRYSAERAFNGILLGEVQLTDMYLHNGMARRIVDCPAEEMTRAGFEIKDIPEELEADVLSRLEALDVNKHFNTALKWAGAFGGALIVLGIKDGGNLETPLNEDDIDSVEFMRVYDRFEVMADSKYDDPENSNYGKVELWSVNSRENAGHNYKVHESRVLIIDGESTPNSTRVSNLGWGVSTIEKCITQLYRLDYAHKYSGLLLERMQQAVHGIPGLSDTLASPEGEKLVTKRVAIVDAVRSALNTVVIDAEESFEVKNSSVSGVADILDRNAEAVSAVVGIPMFVLFGRSIGGLNSTGETNQEAWNAQVASMQNDKLRNPVDKLVGFVIRSLTKGSTDGGAYKIEFNPLSVPNKKDQAEIDNKKAEARKKDMETAKGYVEINALDAYEVREMIAEEYEIEDPMPLPDPEPIDPATEITPAQSLNQNA